MGSWIVDGAATGRMMPAGPTIEAYDRTNAGRPGERPAGGFGGLAQRESPAHLESKDPASREPTMADSKTASALPLPDAMTGNFQEAARWFNQLWSGMGQASTAGAGGPIPSMLLPTLDVKEIDKRIADLRSVEHWLQLNQGLLHSTIQGLEMQRNTLSAWQSFGAAASGAGTPSREAGGPGAPADKVSGSTASDMPAFQPALWWAALQEQFAQMAASAAAGAQPTQSSEPTTPDTAGATAQGARPHAAAPKTAAPKPSAGPAKS